ncbi:hypothetical protein V1499_23115 (plasmid) [Neobacillus sp. SCS-31]|uniref:hypothetical protein n=1 Tax=Neobacillus oceani TaxID=3115292 RepID=UPI003906AE87
MVFDKDKYKKIFENRHGAGSFDRLGSQAEEAARLKVAAEFAKSQYKEKYNEEQKRKQEAAERHRFYGQTLAEYEKTQQRAREQGRGGHRPSRDQMLIESKANEKTEGFSPYAKDEKKKTLITNPDHITDYAKQKLGFKPKWPDPKPKAQKKDEEKAPAKKNNNGGGIWGDLKAAGKAAEDFFNPFDNVKAEDAVKNFINRNQSDAFKGLARGSNRVVDSASLNLMSNLDKKLNNRDPYYNSDRKMGDGGGTDMLTSGLGYLVPGAGFVKGAKALGVGAKAGTKGLAKAGQLAKEGAIVGGAMSVAEVGIREGLNPDDTNWKQNLGHIGLGVGVGAAADPALYGLGKGLKASLSKLLPKKNAPINEAVVPSVETEAKEVLGLPAPQLQLPPPVKQKPSLETFFQTFKKPEGLKTPFVELPEKVRSAMNKKKLEEAGVYFGHSGRNEPKPRLESPEINVSRGDREALGRQADNILETVGKVQNQPSNHYEKRLIEVQQAMKQIHDSRKQKIYLPELSVDELYSMVRADADPKTFDELVKLNELEVNFNKNNPVQGPRESNLKDSLNNDPKIVEFTKDLFPPERPEPKISRVATLDEMVDHLEGMAPPKQEPIEPTPLEFRREKGFNPEVTTKGRNPLQDEFEQAVESQMKTIQTIFKGKSDEELRQMAINALKGTGDSPKWKPEALNRIEKQISKLQDIMNKSPEKSSAVLPEIKALEEQREFLLKLNLQLFSENQKVLQKVKPLEEVFQELSSLKKQSEQQTPNPKGKLNAEEKTLREYEAITPKKAEDEEFGVVRANDPIWNVRLNPSKLKDINGIQGYMSDIYRNTRDVFGDKFQEIKNALLDPFDHAKKEYVELQETWLNRLNDEIVKGLGISKGSKLSKLVQDYGEKTISLDQLKQAAPKDWQKVVKADEWFRKAYESLIDEVNASRASIYPTNPDKLVPKRNDYYRHFRELNGLEGIKNLFDTPAGIDPQLVGTSDFTNPSSRWASFMQKRGKGPYKSDAVGGFLNYLPSASYAIKIDPHIPRFKEFSRSLKGLTGGTKNLNHYIEFVEDFARDLAGKTNFLDRPFQKWFGRRTFRGLEWLNTRVKKNTVLGNLGSTLAQVANIPNGIAFAKHHSVPGAIKTLKSIIVQNKEAAQSGFLKERFSHSMYEKFNTRLIDQPEKFASWVMSTADRIGTTFVWNSAYQKGLAQKVADPIKYADDATRNLVAGRGIGEVPLVQKSKLFQLIAPFQLEVANLWHVQRDFIKEKDFGAIVTLYLGSWLLNKGMEEVRGSAVTFDPIDAIHDAFTEEDLSGWEKAGRIGGEILSNVPLGQTAANFYPEYGTKNLPTREEFFGDRDPNRFGSGLLVAKGAQDPIFKLALPFGGAQAQKSLKGLDALKKEGVYNKAETKLKYPVENDALNSIKGTLFGPGAFREAREFYDKDRQALGEKQTLQYENIKASGGNSTAFYEYVLKNREISSIKEEMKGIQQDNSLSLTKKQERLLELHQRLQNLLKQ